jgi:hypothetical protein
MVWSKDPQLVGQQFFERGNRAGNVPGLGAGISTVLAGCQRVMVIWTEDPQLVYQHPFEGGKRAT